MRLQRPVRESGVRGGRGAGLRLLALAIVAALNVAAGPTGPDKHVAAKTGQAENSDREKRRRGLERPYVLVGAGDIAACAALEGAEATAKLIEQIPGTVFAAGDLAYERGTEQEFRDCYGRTWGRFKDRTKPTPGNHEYNSSAGVAYFAYWGAAAGTPDKSYY